MEETSGMLSEKKGLVKGKLQDWFSHIPLLSWLFGGLVAVALEHLIGTPLAEAVGLPKIPALFGVMIMLKKILLIPSALIYVLLIYVIPIAVIARLTAPLGNRLASRFIGVSVSVSALIHLGLFYLTLHMWSAISDYRVLTLKLTLIAVMVTLSLNVINGYMGEFSCSHPGFMAMGAYAASVFSL